MTAPVASAAVLIPAYQPTGVLPALVDALSARGVSAIVVVDDGSGPAFDVCFDALRNYPGVVLLRHATNLGKGAALKTGLNYLLHARQAPAAIVTADADGQHHPDDILRVFEAAIAYGDRLVLGTRQLRSRAPWRSRFGNNAARLLFNFLSGQALEDTQTGLRGIPVWLASRLIRLDSTRYEFELEALILAARLAVPVMEIPIQTIYLDRNASSHFNPVIDSLRVCYVLMRFGVAARLRRRNCQTMAPASTDQLKATQAKYPRG